MARSSWIMILGVAATLLWITFFLSKTSVLVYRSEGTSTVTGEGDDKKYSRVFCVYLHALGTERNVTTHPDQGARDSYSCPRHKTVGSPIAEGSIVSW